MKHRIHVQVALVGGQPTPVYQGITHLKPDQIVLVCSRSSHNVADDIRSQLHNYQDKDILTYQVSDHDIEQMYRDAEGIVNALPKGITISLNVSSGMKLWSIIYYNVFRRRRRCCNVFFIGQNGVFFDMKNKTSDTKVNFDMEAQFKILGHEIASFTPLSEYTKEDNAVLNIIQNWWSSDKYKYPLYLFTKDFYEDYRKVHGNTSFLKAHSFTHKFGVLNWDPTKHAFDGSFYYKPIHLESPHAEHILLNTGWFELYVARMIEHKFPSGQVRMNCVFNNKVNATTTQNEVDIIVNTGNKLIFVECKTQVYKSTDVDKFNSVVKNYGGLGSKHLFVTWSKMENNAQEKCYDYGINTFYFDNPIYRTNQDKIDALSKVLEKLEKEWNIK